MKKTKKMMTSGMSNKNAKAVAQKVPGSKGVTPGVNPKVSATPTKSYGGKMKMGGKMGYGGMKKKAC